MIFFLQKSKSKKILFFFWGGGGEGGAGRTDEQAQTNVPLQLLRSWGEEVGGITMHKCTSYGPDKPSF